MLAKYIKVLIRRDMAETIGTAVFEHELEILKDIHGEGNVTEADEECPTVEIDAADEYERLANTYGANDQGQMYVERCIGRGPKQLEALGVKKVGRPKKDAEE